MADNSFIISKKELLKEVKSNLEAAISFNDNIWHLAESIPNSNACDGGESFISAIRYNQQCREVSLSCAAALLKLVGLFDEYHGDIANIANLSVIVDKLAQEVEHE